MGGQRAICRPAESEKQGYVLVVFKRLQSKEGFDLLGLVGVIKVVVDDEDGGLHVRHLHGK